MLMPSIFGENLFDDFFSDFTRPVRSLAGCSASSSHMMRTDIKETGNGYELDIDLPGFNKNDVQAELKDGYLTINAAARKNTDEKDSNGKYIRRERYYGTCRRSFYVGGNVTQEEIKAKFENGILKISVPKKETKPAVEKNQYIAIEG